MEKKIEDVIKQFRTQGIELERQSISYSFGTKEECKELFYKVFQTVDKTAKVIQELPEYETIIDWMVNTEGKGLILTGDCGRGKTTILTGVVPVIFDFAYGKIVKPFSARELVERRKEIIGRWSYCIDEIGVEPQFNNYGEKTELFNDILDDAEKSVKPVFISTNLDGKKIQTRYGVRAMDRIVRLCKIVKFKGESLRR